MSYFMVDIESDGPIPHDFSMVSLGVVKCDDKLDKTFYGQLKPISEKWLPVALSKSGFSREECMLFDDPKEVMTNLNTWILDNNTKSRPMFISDNNGFDWSFINWYFHHFTGDNPFGYSSTNLGSFYKGVKLSMFESFKKLRRTKHDHNPVNDAIGNAEAFHTILKRHKIKH